MIERLALPAWDARPTPLHVWADQLATLGHAPIVSREGDGSAWIEVAPLRLCGFAMIEGTELEAIHFEFHDPNPDLALSLIEAAAAALNWEIHDESEDEEDA